jgi:hypothetical protein
VQVDTTVSRAIDDAFTALPCAASTGVGKMVAPARQLLGIPLRWFDVISEYGLSAFRSAG